MELTTTSDTLGNFTFDRVPIGSVEAAKTVATEDQRLVPVAAVAAGGSLDGIELQDREFVAAVAEGREPSASVASCLPAMRTLDRIEQALAL